MDNSTQTPDLSTITAKLQSSGGAVIIINFDMVTLQTQRSVFQNIFQSMNAFPDNSVWQTGWSSLVWVSVQKVEVQISITLHSQISYV